MIHFQKEKSENPSEFFITIFDTEYGEIGHIRYSVFLNRPKKAYNSIFKDSMSYENFLQHTNGGNFYFLDNLYIDEKFRLQGYANKLLAYFLKFISKISIENEMIILQAHPIEFNIELDALKLFYSKYGFSEFCYDNIYDENGEENCVQNLMYKII